MSPRVLQQPAPATPKRKSKASATPSSPQPFNGEIVRAAARHLSLKLLTAAPPKQAKSCWQALRSEHFPELGLPAEKKWDALPATQRRELLSTQLRKTEPAYNAALHALNARIGSLRQDLALDECGLAYLLLAPCNSSCEVF